MQKRERQNSHRSFETTQKTAQSYFIRDRRTQVMENLTNKLSELDKNTFLSLLTAIYIVIEVGGIMATITKGEH